MLLFGSEPHSPQRTWTVLRPVDPEVLQRMLLYASKTAYYLLGYYGDETRCRLLTFPKQTQSNAYRLEVVEDPRTYTPSEAESYFRRIHTDPSEEGLTLLCEVIPLLPHPFWAERRYRKLLLSGVDLTKDFFFSYTYNISYTVQHNLTHEEHLDPFDCIFVWNAYLTRDLRTALSDTNWVLPLVHGSWQQRNLSIFGKIVHLTLISRRSRRFAGTRYLKRGINQLGWVANEVETEQIVSLQNLNQSGVPSLASIVQIRGSVPLFWGQATSALNPRPSIQLYNMDPLYEATHKHFDDLFERYGRRVVVLNLVKSQERQPRETILRKAFGHAVSFLNDHVYTNDDHEIVYHPWDFKAHMKKDARRFFKNTEPLMQDCVQKTGFCSMHPNAGQPKGIQLQLQQGVMRSNCIDCLDRTNISQYFYGLVALGSQLCSLGLLSTNEIDPDCSFAYQFMQMYEIMGNALALQYGGSEAHGTFFERMRGNSEAATQSRELLRTIKRYYSNAVSDPEKQDAINLFLGHFIPKQDETNIWELDSDYFLHCGVDYEKRHSNFGLRPSGSLTNRPSNTDTGATKLSHKASSVEIFPVPVVSRAGGPEVLPTEQPIKKEASSSGWSLSSWLKPNREDIPFQLPDARGPLLDSFEEMLNINPVVEVRLYDNDINRKQKEEQRPAFQKTIARLLTQEALTERETGTVPMNENRSDSCAGCPSLSSESAEQTQPVIQRHQGRHRPPQTLSDRPVMKNKRTWDLGWLSNDGSVPRSMAKSETRPPCLRRRSWFGGLARKSAESRDKRSTTVAHRTLSTPTDVTRVGIQGSTHQRSLGRSDPVEEFWDEYWSITEQSLTKELTLAERVAIASNKKEAIRLARANNTFVPKHKVGKMTAANVFLDELLDHCLDAKSPVRCIPDQVSIQEPEIREEKRVEVLSDGDASTQETLGVRSNINELLFTSAREPGDRVLEKWYLADQKAKADYRRYVLFLKEAQEKL